VLENWTIAPSDDVSLILLAGGGLRMKLRSPKSGWYSQDIHHGELILRPGNPMSSEVAWCELSPAATRTLHIHLPRETIARTFTEIIESDPGRVSIRGEVGLHDPLLAQIGFALWHELEGGASFGGLYAQTALQLLTVHLLRHYATPKGTIEDRPGGLSKRQMARVTEYILSHLSEKFALRDLAEQTGFSPYHFARLFRQTTGESPHQFVLAQRIQQAQHLLRETDLPPAYIALECGFANQSHLTRQFKRQVGLTPHAYRRDR
jgi:AraC family transcriptional regulator